MRLLWMAGDLIFTHRFSSGANLLLVSSLMRSKYPCVVSIFLVTFFFALTAQTSSGNRLNLSAGQPKAKSVHNSLEAFHFFVIFHHA